MRTYYLLFLFIFLITGCSEDEKELEFREIKIEKHYSYFYKTKVATDIDENTLELFNLKIYSINSINELNQSPLFGYCSEELKEELSKCNFEEYTLLITGTYEEYELIDLESNFGYNNFSSSYIYRQALLCKTSIKPLNNIYLIIDVFSVNKIPDSSKFSFEKKAGLTDS